MVYKAVYSSERKYYKYVISDWTQPTLVANNQFTNGFKTDSYYNCFLPNTGELHVYADERVYWVNIYMESITPLIAKQFTFYCRAYESASSAAYDVSFSGSNDGSTWTTIGTSGTVAENSWGTIDMNSNNTDYRYFRFTCRQGGWGHEDSLTLNSFTLTAKSKQTVESDASDYDFYVDVGTYQDIKDGSTYKAVVV